MGGPRPVSAAILSSDVTCLDLRLNLLPVPLCCGYMCSGGRDLNRRNPQEDRGRGGVQILFRDMKQMSSLAFVTCEPKVSLLIKMLAIPRKVRQFLQDITQTGKSGELRAAANLIHPRKIQ